MKNRLAVIFFILIQGLTPDLLYAQQLSATDIVRKTDEKFNGEMTGYSVMTMTIIRPSWQRTVEFKSWSMEDDYALTLITAPAREIGQTFLKRKNEMWSWNPAINRLIKLPPSMMSQGWMGSDYTNDDILRESSVVEDYIIRLKGKRKLTAGCVTGSGFWPGKTPECSGAGSCGGWIKRNILHLRLSYLTRTVCS